MHPDRPSRREQGREGFEPRRHHFEIGPESAAPPIVIGLRAHDATVGRAVEASLVDIRRLRCKRWIHVHEVNVAAFSLARQHAGDVERIARDEPAGRGPSVAGHAAEKRRRSVVASELCGENLRRRRLRIAPRRLAVLARRPSPPRPREPCLFGRVAHGACTGRGRDHGAESFTPLAPTCKRLWKYRTCGATLRCLPPSTTPPAEAPQHLADILRALPQGELDGLISRLAIRIDPAKRIDVSSQVARALVSLPELRDPARLHPASLELIHRVAEARGTLVVSSVPPALEPLLARGLMFARAAPEGIELILPAAYLVQLKTWEGEDPRSLRALLPQTQFETMSAIAAHYLGRPATPPIALSLEPAWDVVGNPQRLAEEIARLSPTERRVLEGVEADGGEGGIGRA